ncbi:RICIN domain-containing protein [Streptosporangiaceae bacterium NEAU-GS5]|nr:RICIN domain-containing protein [Streptosporangiaceae bacterium NEAU-GS5]
MKITRRVAGIFCTVGATIALTTTAGGAAKADTVYAVIQSSTRGAAQPCLDVIREDGWNNPGARIQQWDCSRQPQQEFKLRLVGRDVLGHGGHNFYQIISEVSGMCLNMKDGSTAPHALVVQQVCATHNPYRAGELWSVQEIPTGIGNPKQGFFTIYPYSSLLNNTQQCLDIVEASDENGALLQQWNCNNTRAQAFWSDNFFTLWVRAGQVNGGWL